MLKPPISYSELLNRESERMQMQLVYESIAICLEPFNPGGMHVDMEETFTNGKVLCVKIDLFKEPVVLREFEQLGMPLNPIHFAAEVGYQVGQIFAQRYIEPEGHIELGEN